MASSDRPPPNPLPPPPPRRANPLIPGVWIVLAVLIVIGAVYLLKDSTKAIDYSDFKELVDAGQIKKLVLIGTERATGEVRDPAAEPAARIGIKSGKFEVNLPHAD